MINLDGEVKSGIQFGANVNYIHQSGGLLAVAFNEPYMPIHLYEWDISLLSVGRLLFETTPASFPGAVKNDGQLLYITDIFG